MKKPTKYLALSYKAGRNQDSALIDASLASVNGSASAHTITSARQVADIAADAEKYLADHGVKKDLRAGTKLSFRPAGPIESTYKYAAITTRISLVRTTTGWYLLSVERDAVHPRQPQHFRVEVTDAALQYAVEQRLKAFGRTLEGYDRTRKTALDAAAEDAAIAVISKAAA